MEEKVFNLAMFDSLVKITWPEGEGEGEGVC